MNDGTGNFTWDASRIEGIVGTGIFTAELVDVDRDGYVDLLAAGHEHEGFSTQILWGDNSGVFTTLRLRLLLRFEAMGSLWTSTWPTPMEIGDRDVVLNRTGDERGPGTYHGYYVQLLEQTAPRSFADRTQLLLHENENAEADWVIWLRVFDIDEDGDPDIFADEVSRHLIWKNDGSGNFHPGPLRVVPPNHAVDEGTSHSLQNPPFQVSHSAVRDGQPGGADAWTYGDFDDDGDVDIFYAPRDYPPRSFPAELYVNDGTDTFLLNEGFIQGHPPRSSAATKALPGDYNGDGRVDVLVTGVAENPKEPPYVLLSSGDRFLPGQSLEAFAGVNYGAASADVDADGDLDVFVTDPPSFLLNDGSGSFRAGPRIEGLVQFLIAAELVDVDGDGYVDLLVGGDESEADPTQVIWGDSTGVYSTSGRSILPAVAGHGVILDIDVADTDGDGDRDVVVARTGDESGIGFYEGYYVQLVEHIGHRQFRDVSSVLMPENRDDQANSLKWIRLYDFDGDSDIDIVVDDYSGTDLLWKNDGQAGSGAIHKAGDAGLPP